MVLLKWIHINTVLPPPPQLVMVLVIGDFYANQRIEQIGQAKVINICVPVINAHIESVLHLLSNISINPTVQVFIAWILHHVSAMHRCRSPL